MAPATVGRNDPCPCGSGRKYKHCCERKQNQTSRVGLFALVGLIVAMAAVLIYNFTAGQVTDARQVWDPEHGHYHTVP